MKSLKFHLLLALGLVCLIYPASSTTSAYPTCNGSIADCNEENEQSMESEISRRFLAQQKTISYRVLNRNQPVCSGGAAGESYSKNGGCLPPPSNPPTRGCPKYYRCRSGS
ncbi:Protein RALF-like 32 [Morella rubra]|uniref:Protein RALF-like 32 n=1 Tax=Morella rubra TaxID=262757 RepID=A0A6A1VS99_9ROSI|nr:Protein RALF-like 32 [Morella rubra]